MLVRCFCFILIFITFQAEVMAAPDWVYLSWDGDPCSSMCVQWAKDKQYKNRLQYRAAHQEKWQTIEGQEILLPDKETTLLRASLSQLSPGTEYQLRFADGTRHRFRTLPRHLEHNEELRCVIGGDMLNGKSAPTFSQSVLSASEYAPDFVLFGGDLAYASSSKSPGPQRAHRWLKLLEICYQYLRTDGDFLIPIISTIGNHDVIGGFKRSPEDAPWFYLLFPSWQSQSGYNVVDIGDYLSVFLLDSDHTHPISGPQRSWLKANLKQRVATPHKIAAYHVPAYPSSRAFDSSRSTRIRRRWTPLFDRYHLNLAFEHHDHAYKRTHPLINQHVADGGVVYVGDGAFGVDPRKVKLKNPDWLAASASETHFILLTLSPTQRSVRACRGADGSVFDEYVEHLGT